jgi:predicted transcriptional regulator
MRAARLGKFALRSMNYCKSSISEVIIEGMDMPSGRILRAARVALGFTAQELASKAGIDAATLSRLETHGVASVSGRTFRAVIDALRHAGAEVTNTTITITKKPRR